MHREQKPENRTDVIAADDHDPRALGLVKAAYSVRETCELLSMGRSSLYAALKRGELRRVRSVRERCFEPLISSLS